MLTRYWYLGRDTSNADTMRPMLTRYRYLGRDAMDGIRGLTEDSMGYVLIVFRNILYHLKHGAPEQRAESHTGDAQRFDYVPASHLFPRFQNPPQKRYGTNPTKKPNVSVKETRVRIKETDTGVRGV